MTLVAMPGFHQFPSRAALAAELAAMVAPAFEMEAGLWLDTGRPRQALETVRKSPSETMLLGYFRALAQARLGDLDAAATAASLLTAMGTPLSASLGRHVEAEIHSGSGGETLREAAAAKGVNGTQAKTQFGGAWPATISPESWSTIQDQ